MRLILLRLCPPVFGTDSEPQRKTDSGREYGTRQRATHSLADAELNGEMRTSTERSSTSPAATYAPEDSGDEHTTTERRVESSMEVGIAIEMGDIPDPVQRE